MWNWAQSSLQDLGVDTAALSASISKVGSYVAESVAPLGPQSAYLMMLTQRREGDFINALVVNDVSYDDVLVESSNSSVIHICCENDCCEVIRYLYKTYPSISNNITIFDNKGMCMCRETRRVTTRATAMRKEKKKQ